MSTRASAGGRAALMLEASPLRARERELRSALEQHPVDAALWWQLGLELTAQKQYGACVDAWSRSAELGPKLDAVLLAFHNKPAIRETVGRPANLARFLADHPAHVPALDPGGRQAAGPFAQPRAAAARCSAQEAAP